MGRRPGANYNPQRWRRDRRGLWMQDSATGRHFILRRSAGGWELSEARGMAIGLFDPVTIVPTAALGKAHVKFLLKPLDKGSEAC